MPVDALVTDAHSRASVAGIRALSRAGLSVGALGPRRGAAGLWSRHADLKEVGPAVGEQAAFMARLGELAAAHGPCVVFPGQEETLDPFLAHMHELPPQAVVPYSGPEPVRALRDKAALAGLLDRAGLLSPELLAQGPTATLAEAGIETPCVVKSPGMSAALPIARVAATPGELRELLTALPPDEVVLVQEHASGPLIGLALVIDRDHRVVARFQQTADLLWPVGAGGSRRATSMAPDEGLVDGTARLLEVAGFWGLAQVQYLYTRRGPVLIDVNPRFYGSLPLATASGVNLPAIWHRVALGERVEPQRHYRVGVGYRWLEGEISAAIHGQVRDLFRRSPKPGSGAMWAADDPVPSAVMAAEAAWPRVRRVLLRR